MLNKVNVEVPDNIAVPCPKHDFLPTLVGDNCLTCEYYDGLGVMTSNMALSWEKQYAIRCTHPIERRAIKVIPDVKTVAAYPSNKIGEG